jgi:hypothetical protein
MSRVSYCYALAKCVSDTVVRRGVSGGHPTIKPTYPHLIAAVTLSAITEHSIANGSQ